MYSDDFFLEEKWLKKIDRQTKDLIDRIGVDRKTVSEVFDKTTLILFGKLISDEIIEYLDFVISTGKEANIFRAVTPKNKFLAIKIFRTSTSTFKHIQKYIEGDPRFKGRYSSRREIVFEWTKKEYKNLNILNEIKIPAPKPIFRKNNVLLMSYIGSKKEPAPQLKDIKITNPEELFDTIISYISIMFKKGGIVHADLSPYNILFFRNKPYLIDLGQGVLLEHPYALDFLKRDILNIVQFFNKLGIRKDSEKIFKKITKSS